MRDIREILEAVGVEWRKGKMVCPACGAEKLTASEKKNIARCWGCNAKWWRGMKQRGYLVSWGTALINPLAELCLKSWAEFPQTLAWLHEVRGLPSDPKWLAGHAVGVHPGVQDLTEIIGKAKGVLAKNREKALAACTDEQKKTALQAFFEAEEKLFKTFVEEKLQPLFKDDGWKGSVVFCYENSHADYLSLNVRNWALEGPNRKDKHIYRLQPVEGRRGVFFPLMDGAEHWNQREHPEGMLVFEGEMNWLSLMAQCQKWREQSLGEFIPPGAAVGGKNGADVHTLSHLFNNYPPTVIYDNDTKDWETGKPSGYELVKAINWQTACYAVTTRTKDMDDWVRQWNPQPKDLEALVDSAEFLPRPFEAVKAEIDKVTRGKSNRFVERAVTDIVVNDMLQRGEFYNVSYGVFVHELKERNEIIEIRHGHKGWMGYIARYGIQPGEKLATTVGKNIGIMTEDPHFAKRNKIRTLFMIKNTYLFLNEFDGNILAIDKKGNIERYRNGEHGVLFRNEAWANEEDKEFLPMTPFKVDIVKAQASKAGLKFNPDSLLSKFILDTVNYSTDKGLRELSAKQLLQTYIVSLFFRDWFKTKIAPVWQGPAGAGKNSISQFLGLLLVGEKFHVNPMPEDPKTLAEMFIGVPFAAFDEWGISKSELENKLKSLLTSCFEKRRELYTTAQMIEFECEAEVMLSTNANPTKTAALGQRFLLFDVGERATDENKEVYRSMGLDLTRTFMQNRNALWTELVGRLANVMREFYRADFLPTAFRMADFGSFMEAIAAEEGWKDEAKVMLQEMMNRQTSLAMDRSLVMTTLREWLESHPAYWGRFETAKTWAVWLHNAIPENDREARGKMTSHYLSYCLMTNETIFKSEFGMKKEGGGNRSTKYAFAHLPGGVEAPRSGSATSTPPASPPTEAYVPVAAGGPGGVNPAVTKLWEDFDKRRADKFVPVLDTDPVQDTEEAAYETLGPLPGGGK